MNKIILKNQIGKFISSYTRNVMLRSPLFKSRRLYAPAPMIMITERRLNYFAALYYYYEAPSINKSEFLHDRD